MEKKVHHRRYRLTVADPAGNITALIEAADDEPVPAALWTDDERQQIVRRVMREHPDVEQAGFVIPCQDGETGKDPRFSPPFPSPSSLWRLEMAGGEFCGNAARSFGLFIAQKTGLCGTATVHVTVSGAENPLAVLADTQNSTAEVALPPPRKAGTVPFQGANLPAVIFDGITHVIMEGAGRDTDKAALTETFFTVKKIAEAALGPEPPAAFGVMFYDTERAFLRPAVFVNGIETFVFENSCGSGSAALAWYRALCCPDGTYCHTFQQPGGAITARLTKAQGEIAAIFIGGNVCFQ